MQEIGQWILLVACILVFLGLIFAVAKLLFRVFVLVAAALIIVGTLHYFSLLPESCQKYVQETVSEENVTKVKTWAGSWCPCEKSAEATPSLEQE